MSLAKAKVVVVWHHVFPALLTRILIAGVRMLFVFTLYSLPYAVFLPSDDLFVDHPLPNVFGPDFFQVHVGALIVLKNRFFLVWIFKFGYFHRCFQNLCYNFLRHLIIGGIVAILTIFKMLLLIIYVLMIFIHLVYIFDHFFFFLIFLFLLLLLMLFKFFSHLLKQFLRSCEYQIPTHFLLFLHFLDQLISLAKLFYRSAHVYQILLHEMFTLRNESKCILFYEL